METTTKKLGNLNTLILKLDGPMKMDFEVDTKGDLSVYVGQNGTGKTLILVIQWFVASLAAFITSPFPKLQTVTQFAEAIFPLTFDRHEEFNGVVKSVFASGAEIEVTINKGHIEKVEYFDFEDKEQIGMPVFMSSQMRTFSAMSMYLKMRKMAEGNVEKMTQNYKLYDVTQMEKLIARSPIKMTEGTLKALSSYEFPEGIETLTVDLDKCDFYVTFADGSKRYMTTFGNGHQAAMNMFVTVAL